MKIHQLEQFEAIASSRTMREAADKLYLSQPALSQNLKKLESELGCTLFDRSHNQLELTPYGEILLAHAHRILFDLKEMQAELDAQKARDALVVRVGGFHAPLDVFVMPQIEAAFPKFAFAFERHQPEMLAKKLENGLLDIIFVPQDYKLAHKKNMAVCEESLLISLSANCPFAKTDKLDAAQMGSLEFIIPEDLPGVTPWYEATLKALSIPESRITRLPSKKYLEEMDLTPKAHFTTSLMSLFISSANPRPSVPVSGAPATRSIIAVFDAANEKARALADYIEQGKAEIFSSHAFLPFLLYHDGNLLK